MMNWSIETFLEVHIFIVSVVLVGCMLLLLNRSLFHWKSAGFWAWISFLLYYVLNPLFSLQQGDITRYRMNLYIAGGIERGLWILFMTVIGILVFFISYQNTKFSKVTWNLKDSRFTIPMMFVIGVFMVFGIYSLLVYRSIAVPMSGELIIQQGRFVGQVTGYGNSGHLFLVVPIILMLVAKSPFWRFIGMGIATAFVWLALPSGWGRVVPISMLLAISIADTLGRNGKWPRMIYLPLLLILTISLQMRGHTAWTVSSVGDELSNLAFESFKNVGGAVGSREVSMLATWYLESFVKDRITGYDYGLTLLNYVLTGWIPSRIFPQKYFLIDWLRSSQADFTGVIGNLLYGAKPSLLGSFYSEGGILAVVIMSATVGFLSRKLDGMLTTESHPLVKATGIAWMSILWMVWGSHDYWGVMVLGVIAMPALLLWWIAPKTNHAQNTSSTT